MGKRSIVYIDGFNLYYGALKNTQNKWLNLEYYFKRLRQDDEIQKIWYFTALIKGSRRVNQDAYLAALSNCCPLVEVKYGLFKEKELFCRVSCSHTYKRYLVYEEKGTDVNIALQMLDDTNQKLCERVVLVSGDSDLVPALQLVKKRSPEIEISVYVPSRDFKSQRGAAKEIRDAADKDFTLFSSAPLLSKSQFPDEIDTPKGKIIKPSDWGSSTPVSPALVRGRPSLEL